jgi:hypothetical protein
MTSVPELVIRFALALWLGGTLLLILIAPLVFRRLASRDAAGDLFDAILARFEALKHVLSLALVIGVFVALDREGRIPAGGGVVSSIAIFVAVATNVYLAMVLRPRIKYFRLKVGSFDTAAADDPWRRKFDALHRRSVRVLLLGGIATAVALAFRP